MGMYLCPSYVLAVIFCVVTMFCWGSWANTQKLVNKKWRYEFFYFDYVIGVLIAALVFANTMGSTGTLGRTFAQDLEQASVNSLLWAFAGGVVFNIANVLLVSAIDIAGMSVAFPVGIGLALVLGVIWNFLAAPAASGNPTLLFVGVGLVAVAIVLSAISYKLRDAASATTEGSKKKIGVGLALSLLCGLLMSLFYFFVAKSIAPIVSTADPGETFAVTIENFIYGTGLETGKLTPYTANVLFAVGVFLSTFVIIPILMLIRKPIAEKGTPESKFFGKGMFANHLWGWIGGAIWAVGMTLNVIASGVASAAIAYGLGQGATLMSAIWGVFIWREFKGCSGKIKKVLAAMFVCFVAGLALIIYTKLDAPEPKRPTPVVDMSTSMEVPPVDLNRFDEFKRPHRHDDAPIAEEFRFDEPQEDGPAAEDIILDEPVVQVPAAEDDIIFDEPVADEPVVEEPVVEEPVVEEPVVEEPVAEEPVVEEPVAEEPVAEEPVVEEPVVDEPVADEPVADEPAADEPVADEPVADEPAADEPVADEPVADEPVADEPVADEPVADEPVADEPAADEPVADEPAADEPVADEPVADEPTADEPAAE